jgi:hypothetical protein
MAESVLSADFACGFADSEKKEGSAVRKRKLLLLFLLPPLFLTGCWDKKDPEDRTFILALGIDKRADGCQFTFAPADMASGEGGVYQAEGRTLASAVAEVDTKISRKTDLGQLKTIIFSQDILGNRAILQSLLQEMERSQAISEKVMFLATEDSAADCVEAVMKEDGNTGLFLWDFYKNTAREVAVTKGMDLDTFLTEQVERDGNGVIPRISLKEGEIEVGGGIALSEQRSRACDKRRGRKRIFAAFRALGKRKWRLGKRNF